MTVRRINLALQGGGAHGAFTWGVLDIDSTCWIEPTSHWKAPAIASEHRRPSAHSAKIASPSTPSWA